MISNFNFGGLMAVDRGTGFREMNDVNAKQLMYPGQSYHFAIDHDGERATWILDGERMNSVPVGELTGGEVFLLVHTNIMTRITKLSMEGVVDGARRLRRRMATERVAALFGG